MRNAKIKSLSRLFVLALILLGAVSVSSALIAINSTSKIQASWETFELGRSEKARALGALRKETGYGGMIHQFKNYILRQDQARTGVINARLGGINAAISHYATLGLDAEEVAALDDIRLAVDEYSKNLSIAEQLARIIHGGHLV